MNPMGGVANFSYPQVVKPLFRLIPGLYCGFQGARVRVVYSIIFSCKLKLPTSLYS
jgi:hypothetical protein